MANSTITHAMIASEGLMRLKNTSVLANLIYRDYDKDYNGVINGHTKGDTINISVPPMYQSVDGPDITGKIIDVEEGKRPITLDQHKTVPVEFGVKELTLDIAEFGELYIQPAIDTLCQDVESTIASQYKKFWNFTGTPGTVPTTFKELGEAGVIMTNGGVSGMGRVAVHDPEASLNLADGLKTTYVQGIAKKAIEEASFGKYANFKNYESASIQRHTVGAHGGTPLVNGVGQVSTYSTVKDDYKQALITNGWTNSAAIFKEGDVFTIAGVYAVNPGTLQTIGRLQDFVVRADVSADGSGNATLSISPPIIIDGAFQTVDAAPADDAVITVRTGTAGSSYAQSMCFQKNAIALVMKPFQKPESATVFETRMSKGFALTFAKGFDIKTYAEIHRFDLLFGVETIHAALGARLTS